MNKVIKVVLMVLGISLCSYSAVSASESPVRLFAPAAPGWLDQQQASSIRKTRKMRVRPRSSQPRIKTQSSYPRALPVIRRVRPVSRQ